MNCNDRPCFNLCSATDTFACNCQYGTQDPRCCVNKAQRRQLEDAWRRGKEGKPLPPEDKLLYIIDQIHELKESSMGVLQDAVNEVVANLERVKAEIVAEIARLESENNVDLSALHAVVQGLDDVAPAVVEEPPAEEPEEPEVPEEPAAE